jgi:hypothetical protein
MISKFHIIIIILQFRRQFFTFYNMFRPQQAIIRYFYLPKRCQNLRKKWLHCRQNCNINILCDCYRNATGCLNTILRSNLLKILPQKLGKIVILWHACWKPELWSQQKQPLRDGRNRHACNNRRAVRRGDFCVAVPRLYNEDHFPERESTETAVRRVGDWCEMAASLRGREAGNRGSSVVGRRYQAAQWRSWLRTLVFV